MANAKQRSAKDNVVFHDIARFRSQLFDRMLKPFGLTMSQAWVLVHLKRENELTQSELAKRIEVGTVTLGGLIDRLEARGFVERHSDPNDRRANRIRLAENAVPLIEVLNRHSRAINEIAYRGLPKEAVEEMNKNLITVRNNLLGALNEGRPAGLKTGEGTQRKTTGGD